MTPQPPLTYDQIDAALPLSPAGIYVGDLTDPDDRRAAIEWLLRLYTAAAGHR